MIVWSRYRPSDMYLMKSCEMYACDEWRVKKDVWGIPRFRIKFHVEYRWGWWRVEMVRMEVSDRSEMCKGAKGSLPVGSKRTHDCRDDPSQRSFTRSYACCHHRFTRFQHASLVHITTFYSVVDASSSSCHSLSLRTLTRIVFMWSHSLMLRDVIVVCIVMTWW